MDDAINKVLHQPIRLRIMVYLAGGGACDYTTLKNRFALSDGHMTTHMRELLVNDYVAVTKSFIDRKPCTMYRITVQGRAALMEYVAALRAIVESVEG